MDIFNHPPKFIKKIFKSVIWETGNEELLFTIDDGPSENTLKILRSLKEKNIKAVFFCTGKNIEKFHEEFLSIEKDGHVIAGHGYNHKHLVLRSLKSNIEEIDKTDKIIKRSGISPSVLFRPSYGRFDVNTIKAAKITNKKIMLWSLLSGDHTGDFAHVRRLVDSYLDFGNILVLHDNKKSSDIFEQSLEYITNVCNEKGISIADSPRLQF